MAQLKPIEKNLRNDRDCGSKAALRGHSANYSADCETQDTNQKILDLVGLSTPASAFNGETEGTFQFDNLRNTHEHCTGNIFHLFPQSAPTVPQYIRDIETLKPAALKQAYPKEYQSWRNRRDYAKKAGIAFYPPWQSFPVFLREVGPISAEGYTLDKIEPAKGYVPGNVRWASKATQTHNRSNTVWLIYNGERKPLGVWAKEIGCSESTLRSRREKGWPDENIITGIPPEKATSRQKSTLPPTGHPWPDGHAQQWERQFQKDTDGRTNRLWYLGYRTARSLRELSDEADSVRYPDDDYQPTPDEAAALETFTQKWERWQDFWRHFQREMMNRHGRTFPSPDDPALKRYR